MIVTTNRTNIRMEGNIMAGKLWANYSYILVFFGLALMASIYFILQMGGGVSYHSIEVQDGDTLWTIAEEYSSDSSMSTDEFIKWVGERNNLSTYTISAGDSLVLPVEKKLGINGDYQYVMNEE
ncbi:LysM peptidoglycan-binding domain-containing protein [Rossellomorea marisflavi]|uniref:LysM peptidoglycan-binding domain-containing protein n=4 Tax=Bacillaceae TaxID=186817 RepID=A0A5D4RVM6_9BACI|nr:LysM peptidoglycan-binding domain-containing protein [Rossellomorea marisflavi]